MANGKSSVDWMLVQIRGYNEEKGYIYAAQYPDGKHITIARKNKKGEDFIGKLHQKGHMFYAPVGSVVAVYDITQPRDDRDFFLAGFAKTVSTNLAQEDVYVTPIKVSDRLQKSGDNEFVTAMVLDADPIGVSNAKSLRAAAKQALERNAGSAIALRGPRGFMIRIGFMDGAEKSAAKSWEFMGRSGANAGQTWDFHWTAAPRPGRQKNLLKTIASAVEENLKDPKAFVEVVGITRTIVKDFGKQQRRQNLIGLPNYKESVNDQIVPSYSMAAIVVEKQDASRNIKNQFPLPNIKPVTQVAGLLGRHRNGDDYPVQLAPLKLEANKKVAQSVGNANTASTAASRSPQGSPLRIRDHINQSGEVRSFIVTGSAQALAEHKDRILSAAPGVKPYLVKGGEAYAFPLNLKKIVESNLFDLAGTSPFYLAAITNQGERFLAIEGQTMHPRFKDAVLTLETSLGKTNSGGKYLIPENRRHEILLGLKRITDQSIPNTPKTASSVDQARPADAQQAPTTAANSDSNPRSQTARQAKRLTFGEWLDARFNRDPLAIMDHLDATIQKYAEEAGIDWNATRNNITFTKGGRPPVIKSPLVVPLDLKRDKGSVAVQATVIDNPGRRAGEGITYITLKFWNAKLLKGDSIKFQSYPYLYEEFQTDLDSGVAVERNDQKLEEVRRLNEQRARQAEEKLRQQKAKAERSIAYWMQKIPTLPVEDGANTYWGEKKVDQSALKQLDVRQDSDERGLYSIYPLYDINDNFVGAQRIFENAYAGSEGKDTNKDFITGTAFDDENGLPLGTHALLGEVVPEGSTIHVAEGAATAWTVYASTNEPCFICLNKSNIPKVVRLLREKYPLNNIVIAYDNDAFKPHAGNSGQLTALQASRDFGVLMAGPDFSGLDISGEPTDFNDLHQLTGLETVRKQLSTPTSAPKDPIAYALAEIALIGTDKLGNHFEETCKALGQSDAVDQSEEDVAKLLFDEAIRCYGVQVTINAVNDDYLQSLNLNDQGEPEKADPATAPITIVKHIGQSEKKSVIIRDHRGDLSEEIEDALNTVLGSSRKRVFNETLGGWIAPFHPSRMIATVLHQYTGEPQLYISDTRKQYNGVRVKAIRGDFRDPELKNKVAKQISFARPEYVEGEFGFVIRDLSSIPYIQDTLRSYLTPKEPESLQKAPAPAIDSSEEREPSEEQLFGQSQKEACQIANIDAHALSKAHTYLLFKESNNLYLQDDYIFAAIYARSLQSFDHLPEAERHDKAFSDAILNARALLERSGTGVLSESVAQRLHEIVNHFEVATSLTEIGADEKAISEDIVDLIADKKGLDIDQVRAVINGDTGLVSSDVRSEIIQHYRTLLTDDLTELASRTQSLEAISDKAINPLDVDPDNAQLDRIQELLLILRNSIEKGFSNEEFYDLFLTQRGSPYFDTVNERFDQASFNLDLKLLSDPEASIPSWETAEIFSASGLYVHEYNAIAARRLASLESFIAGYFNERGTTTFKSFYRYLIGQIEVDGLELPDYLIDGELDKELLKMDVEQLTDFPSVNALYRDMVAEFNGEVTVESPAIPSSHTPDTAISAASPVEVLLQERNGFGRAVLTQHQVDDRTLYQLNLDGVLDDNTYITHWVDYSANPGLLEAQAVRWLEVFEGEPGEGLPLHSMKTEFNAKILDKQIYPGIQIALTEFAGKNFTFYAVDHLHERQSGFQVELSAITSDYDTALDVLNASAAEIAQNAPEETSSTQADTASPESPKAQSDLSALFKRWASQQRPWEEVKTELQAAIGSGVGDEAIQRIKEQYDNLRSRYKPADDSQASDRYAVLYAKTVAIAEDELIFDDYVEEFFKPEGMLVNSNPYWNKEKETIDRAAAMNDIRGAGYTSLVQFYEGIFRGIHHRSSSEHVLSRVGGYIPNHINGEAALRPQFESLAKIFDRINNLPGTEKAWLPPFSQWIESPDSVRIAHPVFSEDLSTISSSALWQRYSKDELLMLADVHGVNVSASDSPEQIADKTLSLWELRQDIAEVGVSSLGDMEPEQVTNLINSFELSISGSHEDRCRRLDRHIERLKRVSHLRIAQYSYIHAALQLQDSNGVVPRYALSAISSFITNETEFLGNADRAIEDGYRARLRLDIDSAMKLVGADNAPFREVMASTDFNRGDIIGIDESKTRALIYSDKQLDGSPKLKRYSHKYVLPADMQFSSLILPPEITHYARFENNIIGTAVALDNDYVARNNLLPVSDNAVVAAASPMSAWCKTQGYISFIDSAGAPRFAIKGATGWDSYVIAEGEITKTRHYSSEKELLKDIAPNIANFTDRDVLVEAFIQECRHNYAQAIDKLQQLQNHRLSADSLSKIIAITDGSDFDGLVGDVRDESPDLQLKLLADNWERIIRESAWKEIQSGGSEFHYEGLPLERIDDLFANAEFEVTNPALPVVDESEFSSVIDESEPSSLEESAVNSDEDDDLVLESATEAEIDGYIAESPSNRNGGITSLFVDLGPDDDIDFEVEDSDYIEATGKEYLDNESSTRILETENRIGNDAVYLFPDGSYQSRSDDEVSEIDEMLAAQPLENASQAEKHTHALDVALGETADLFGFTDDSIDDKSIETDPLEYDKDNQVTAGISVDNNAVVIGKPVYVGSEITAIEEARQIAGPSRPSFDEFLKSELAYQAHQDYMQHDPRIFAGMKAISKLSFEQIKSVCIVLGVHSGQDKVGAIENVRTMGIAIDAMQSVVNGSGISSLHEEQLIAIQTVSGLDTNSLDDIGPIEDWLNRHYSSMANRLAHHNYEFLYGQNAGIEPTGSIVSVEPGVVNLTQGHYSPSVLSHFETVRDLYDAYIKADSESHNDAIAALHYTGLSKGQFLSIAEEHADVVNSISFSVENDVVKYAVGENTFDHMEEAISAYNAQKSRLLDDQDVAFLFEGDIHFGRVLAEQSTNSDICVSVQINGEDKTLVVPIAQVETAFYPSELQEHFDVTFDQFFSGNRFELLEYFAKGNNVESAYLHSIAETISSEMATCEQYCADDQRVIVARGRYQIIDSVGKILAAADTTRSLIEVVANLNLVSAEVDYETDETESLGLNAPRPHANQSSPRNGIPESTGTLDSVSGEAATIVSGNGVGAETASQDNSSPGGRVPGSTGAREVTGNAGDGFGDEGGIAAPRRELYRLAENHDDFFNNSTPQERAELSIAALRVRKEIKESGRPITDSDREVLSRFNGFGGLPGLFNASTYQYTMQRRELLEVVTQEEWESLRRGLLSAYYTPKSVIDSVWDGVKRLGFQGGRVLDPSTGIGHFIGCAPKDIADNSRFSARELDSVSADIASMLYGNDVVREQAYEKARFPANTFDVAISNIPFGDFSVFDQEYKKHHLLIHDYFIVKSLDKVRPGGILAFITSTGTLDKTNSAAREQMFERADLIGAIRLPANTFKGSAGTHVSSDILFMRKREPGAEPMFSDSWVSVSSTARSYTEEEWEDESNNLYFAQNPNMIIGEPREISGRFGPEVVYILEGETTVRDEIMSRIETFPEDIMSRRSIEPEANQNISTFDAAEEIIGTLTQGSYVYNNGEFGIVDTVWNDKKEDYEKVVLPTEVPKTRQEILRDYIELRDATREVLALQMGPYHETDLVSQQGILNQLYDSFVVSYGPVQKPKTSRILGVDPDYPLVAALETPMGQDGVVEKTDIFTAPVIRQFLEPTEVGSSEEALTASFAKYGQVQPDYIAKLTGRSWDENLAELDQRIFKDPHTAKWVLAEQYLSGNIRQKIEEAEAATAIDKEYARNIEPLKAVLPEEIPAYDILARLGSTWIPDEVIGRFMCHVLTGSEDDYKDHMYQVAQAGGFYKVEVSSTVLYRNRSNSEEIWGTSRVPFPDLLDKVLNSRKIQVFDTSTDGDKILNQDETLAANEKAEALKSEFKEWIWASPEREDKLSRLYNNRFNVYVEPKYSPAGVNLHGLATHVDGKALVPYDSQLSAIKRYIVESRALFAHVVGSGKTLELVASAVVGKRLGKHSKALIVVPNNILPQFGNMAKSFYPNCKALVITKDDLRKENRRAFTARIATSNWDMVVIAQSSFEKIATPTEHQRSVIRDEKTQLLYALNEIKDDNRAASMTIKRIEKKLESLENKIEELANSKEKDDLLYLNELGIDALFVDEADNFLNLSTPTQMGHIPGVNTSASQRAMNMLMAVRYVQSLHDNNGGVIFATGTDVRNSMSDMYTMMRYLAPDVLEEAGIPSFDEYMGVFGEVVTGIEVNPEGTGYRQNSRLSRFINVPEMAIMYRMIADIITDDDINLPKPKIDEIKVVSEPCEWLQMYMNDLSRRAQSTRNGGVDAKTDNILKISGDGRKASLDMRLIDPRIPDSPDNKVNKCVQNVLNEYREGSDQKLTQVIFCDQGTPDGSTYNLYQTIKDKLIQGGIPENEVVFAHDFKTDARKDDMQNRLNRGEYRVILGSTEKLGVGNNIQRLLVAEHDLDPPWRPRDLQQRAGRMDRTGNTNPVARRYVYSTKDSFDLFMWETIKRKAGFIHQSKVSPRNAARVLEEDVTPNFSEIMAITTGNPKIREKIELDGEIERLEASERVHRRQQWMNRGRMESVADEITALTTRIKALEGMRDGGCGFPLTINGIEINDHKKGGKILSAAINEHASRHAFSGKSDKIDIGSVGSIPLVATFSHTQDRWVLFAELDNVKQLISDKKIPSQMVQEAMHAFDGFPDLIARRKESLQLHKESLNNLQSTKDSGFEGAERLSELRTKATLLTAQLAAEAEKSTSDQRDSRDFETERKKLYRGGPSI